MAGNWSLMETSGDGSSIAFGSLFSGETSTGTGPRGVVCLRVLGDDWGCLLALGTRVSSSVCRDQWRQR